MAEEAGLEFKAQLDLSLRGDQVKLVAEAVAMANTGGGVIRIGVTDDGTEVGISDALASRFDPARVADLVGSFTSPEHVEITVNSRAVDDGTIVDLTVSRFPDPPLVMSKDGNHEVDGRQRSEFSKGDVLARSGTRCQRATRSSYVAWIREAREAARQVFLDRVAFVTNLPADARLQVAVGGADLAEPVGMLVHAVQAWRQDARRLLGSTELAWLLSGEDSLGAIDNDAGRLLVHSAMRRKATLWHWIATPTRCRSPRSRSPFLDPR